MFSLIHDFELSVLLIVKKRHYKVRKTNNKGKIEREWVQGKAVGSAFVETSGGVVGGGGGAKSQCSAIHQGCIKLTFCK